MVIVITRIVCPNQAIKVAVVPQIVNATLTKMIAYNEDNSLVFSSDLNSIM